jgi:hypothetical protein
MFGKKAVQRVAREKMNKEINPKGNPREDQTRATFPAQLLESNTKSFR